MKEKALLTGSLNLESKQIDSKIDFYKNDTIFFTIKIKGNLQNPEISIEGKFLTKSNNSESYNIKRLFEQGIQKIIDDILNTND